MPQEDVPLNSLSPINVYRAGRVMARQLMATEPYVARSALQPTEYHGGAAGGWGIPRDCLSANSVVVDVGLGEDLDFSRQLQEKYGCAVHGFDPTPKAIAYAKQHMPPKFSLHAVGLAGTTRAAEFFLPSNESHVSGSVVNASHTKGAVLKVDLIDMRDLLKRIGATKVDLLKVDVEGAEYEIIESAGFAACAPGIHILCFEFHHRWDEFGKGATIGAVARLRQMGFDCIWRSLTTNEEFTFVNRGWRG